MESFLVLVLLVFTAAQGVTGFWDGQKGDSGNRNGNKNGWGGQGSNGWGSQGSYSSDPIYATCHVMPNAAKAGELEELITGTVDIRVPGWGLAPAEIKISLSGFSTIDGATSHGFHIHEWGDLSGGCETMGSHYNPNDEVHGAPSDNERHVGDLGNIQEDGAGVVTHTITDSQVMLGGHHSVVGRAIVVHEMPDDLGLGGDEESLKTGNAGTRLACCVIGLADGSHWEGHPPQPTPTPHGSGWRTWATKRWNGWH